MGSLVIDLGAAALILTVLYSRLAIVLGALIATVMLIPATLVTPHLHTSYATVNHVVIAAAALRVAAMARRGALGRDRFRATPLHLAAGLLLLTWVVAGVIFAPITEQPATAEQRVVGLTFAIVFFVVTLALLRELDRPWLVAQLLTSTMAVAAVIAVVEHFSHHAYGRGLLTLAGHPGGTAANVLETRAGHVRVRSSSEFALEFAWVSCMVLPIAAVWAFRTRRWLTTGIPVLALITLGIFWTYSRSAAVAIPVIIVLLAIAVRDRRTGLLAAAAVLAVAGLFALDPTIRHHLSLTTDQGSVGIRFQRLPIILGDITHHAYSGLGLGGLLTYGFPVTDNFYLASYAETGVVGAAVLLALCATGVLQSVSGIGIRDPLRRALVAASAVGFVAFLASGLFDDALLLAQPAELALLLVAVATATAEPERGFATMPRWSVNRLMFLTAAGALAGFVGFLLAPSIVSQQRTFSTIGAFRSATPGDGEVTAPSLIETVCEIANAVRPSLPGVRITCRDNFAVTGEGTLRVESASSARTLDTYSTLANVAHQVYYLTSYQTMPTGPPIKARQTFWQTAPASGATLGFAAAVIAPLPLRRRRKPPAPKPPGDPDVEA